MAAGGLMTASTRTQRAGKRATLRRQQAAAKAEAEFAALDEAVAQRGRSRSRASSLSSTRTASRSSSGGPSCDSVARERPRTASRSSSGGPPCDSEARVRPGSPSSGISWTPARRQPRRSRFGTPPLASPVAPPGKAPEVLEAELAARRERLKARYAAALTTPSAPVGESELPPKAGNTAAPTTPPAPADTRELKVPEAVQQRRPVAATAYWCPGAQPVQNTLGTPGMAPHGGAARSRRGPLSSALDRLRRRRRRRYAGWRRR